MKNVTTHIHRFSEYTHYICSCTEGYITIDIYNHAQVYAVMAYIGSSLYVEPRYRQKKIGTRLMDWAENIARRNGKMNVFLRCSTEESGRFLFHWLRRRGYEIVTTDRNNAYLMKKDL